MLSRVIPKHPVESNRVEDGSRIGDGDLLKLIQIGVGRGVAQDTAHRDDLAFVMESVSQDVMEDECGRPDRNVSIREMQLRGDNEVLLAKA